jgi:hypothetical protein
MSEVAPTVVAETDPFNGIEPSFEEFSSYRETGKVPERFAATAEPKKEEVKAPPAAPGEAKTAEGQEPSPEEQEKLAQERDESGKFKAKEKEPLFTADQQKAFDKAFARREAKLRREFEEQIAAVKSSTTQGTAPAKEPTKEAASSEPAPPELPDITTFQGTTEEFQKLTKEYPAKLAAYLEAKRHIEESNKSLQKKLADSEAKVLQKHPEFKQQFAELIEDVKSGEEPALPQHVLKAIAEDADDPHAITFYLATNREEYRRFAELNPVQAIKEVLRLEMKFQKEASAPAQEVKPRQTSAPAPPEPVTARLTAKAFDANDESLSADEWAVKRWEQVRKR